MQNDFAITLDWRDGYAFSIDFRQPDVPALTSDEPPPLGEGKGPSPTRLLAAAVGSCIAASLKYCFEKARIDLQDLTTTVEGKLVRNERGRLRVGSLRVRLEPTLDPADVDRIGRCLDVFEDFCTVGQSVKDGIDIAIEVAARPAEGVAAGAANEG